MYSNSSLFLDIDYTVRYNKKDLSQPAPFSVEEIGIYEGVLKKLKHFKNAGFLILGVSNFECSGRLSKLECDKIMSETNFLLENIFDDMIYSPNFTLDPEYYTKPNTGMMDSLIKKHKVNVATSIMVGDREEDYEVAARVGISQFYYAKDFFNISKNVYNI